MEEWCTDEIESRELIEAGIVNIGASVANVMAQFLRDSSVQHKLKEFAVMIIRRSRAPTQVVIYACSLINRINYQTRGLLNSRNIRRYFFSALMIAYDLICQESPTMESWVIVSKNKFTLQQVLLLQKAFLSIISWNLFVERETFSFAIKYLLGGLSKVKNPSSENLNRIGGAIMNSRFASVCHSANTSDYSSDADSN